MSIALPARFPERLVAECPDAVIYADAAGNIRYWNAAATRTFGFSAIEAIGSPLDLIIPEWLRSRHWEGYNKVMSGAQSRYTKMVDRFRSSLPSCRCAMTQAVLLALPPSYAM